MNDLSINVDRRLLCFHKMPVICVKTCLSTQSDHKISYSPQNSAKPPAHSAQQSLSFLTWFPDGYYHILNCMCLTLQASGQWLPYATLQYSIPSFPWIAQEWSAWGRNLATLMFESDPTISRTAKSRGFRRRSTPSSRRSPKAAPRSP